MKNLMLESFDKKVISCYLFDEVESPKGIFQITHGMAEHAMRYENFAKFLNENGYIVFTYDQRAHGKTAGSVERVGLADGDLFNENLNDAIFMSKYLIDKYNLPLYFFGHSYGSFITQRYIQCCNLPKKIIICGSAAQKGALVVAGRIIASLGATFKGKDTSANIIKKMTFDSYDKKLTKGESWLNTDKQEVNKYNADEYCGKVFSFGFYKSFFNGLKTLYKKNELAKINKNTPLYLVAGKEDPIGNYGKSVTELYEIYKDTGIKDLTIKLYDGKRHEILNETNKKDVYNDILAFIEK